MRKLFRRFIPKALDNEREQAALRIAVSLVIYACLLPAFFGAVRSPAAAQVSVALLGFLGVAFAILLAMVVRPALAPWPRLIGNVADVAMTSYSMIVADVDCAPLFFVYLFITVGNGFRFGARYLDISLGLSVTGFIAVLALAPFWIEQRGFGIGVAMGLIAICLYSRTLTVRLFEALDEARVANEAKRRFLSTVTHELRTPLNAISGMHDLMRETRLDAQQREMLASIATASQAMLGLVDDVLDFSKIEAGKVELEKADFDLREVVDSLTRMLGPQARAKGLSLVTRIGADVRPAVRGDAFRLRQVLLNLVGNALKFTEHGRIELAIARLEDVATGQRLRFSITDTGIGMSAEALTRIFDSFTQADDSTTRRFGGTGLGTTISLQLVQLLGGELRVESAPGRGSRFWFDIVLLPATGVTGAAAGAVAEVGGGGGRGDAEPGPAPSLVEQFAALGGRAGLTVLVADDNAVNQEVARRILELVDCRVTLVADGEQALDAAEAGGFDLILLDMNMPRLSGFEVAQALGHIEAGRRRTPLMMLSANASDEAIDESRRVGIGHFLSKPVTALRLIAAVAAATRDAVPNAAGAHDGARRNSPAEARPGKPPEMHLASGDDANGIAATHPAGGGPAQLRLVVTEPADPAGPALDHVRLAELEQLGPDFVARLAERFAADNRRLLDLMRSAVAEQRTEAFARLAHEMRGVCLNLGAHGLGDRCGAIEAMPLAQLHRNAQQLFDQLVEESAAVRRALRADRDDAV